MTPTCPCCGQPVTRADAILVSGNTVSRLGATAQLTVSEMAVFQALLKKHPQHARKEAIIMDVYGIRDEPEWPENVIRTHMTKMRPKLAPLGIAVRVVWGLGYKLDLHQAPISRRAA